jgi:spoIIIJ-associated protein
MVQNLAQEVLERRESRWLPPMSAYERRVAHLALKEIEGIDSESEGLGPERRVVIRPKK